MEEKIVIIHGYSDCSASFSELKQWLINSQQGSVETIFYADYESREDSLTFNDVADGLNDELIKNGLLKVDGTSDYKLKFIVHSTGGLVVRYWIWRYYYNCGTILQCPVKNVVMLAPANFGSPLAHRGKSFLGSLVKGRWKIGDMLEVGKKILDGLELASPFQWSLAHKDLLIKDPYFNSNQIKVTILVGDKDYEGFRGWVNKPGTDGTVVISGTNLDAVKLTLEFVKPDIEAKTYQPYKWSGSMNVCDIAFGIVSGYDHGSIVEKCSVDDALGGYVLKGLVDDKSTFDSFKEELKQVSKASYERSGNDRYQQFIFHVVDDYGISVDDFSLEFYIYKNHKTDGQIIVKNELSRIEEDYTTSINEIITSEVHQNTNDKSYRRLLVNHHKLSELISSLSRETQFKDGYVISMKVYVPEISKGIQYKVKNLENVVIFDSGALNNEVPNFFFENTTTFVELQVDRFNRHVRIGTEFFKH